MLPSFRVPTPAPRGCGRAPIVNSVPAGGARLRGGGGVVAPTGRPEAIHFTEHFMTCLWLEEFSKCSKVWGNGQRGGDTAPFAQVVALAAPWMRGRRPKGPETKLENFENRGGGHLSTISQDLPPAEGPEATCWETLKTGATALLNVFQNLSFGPLEVAAGIPMRSHSRLQRPRYMFDPSRWPLRGP
jgi:hypothetical protein